MNITLQNLEIPGCHVIATGVFRDERGSFQKLFQKTVFEDIGLETAFREEYFSFSLAGVVRGMHFQLPPADYVKIVTCLSGKAFDVIVDLRVGSPTYGRHVSVDLAEDDGRSVYIPKGCAHGFQALAERTLLLYQVSTEYNPRFDSGIRWDSLGIPWPQRPTALSRRDAEWPSLEDFDSPFAYGG